MAYSSLHQQLLKKIINYSKKVHTFTAQSLFTNVILYNPLTRYKYIEFKLAYVSGIL